MSVEQEIIKSVAVYSSGKYNVYQSEDWKFKRWFERISQHVVDTLLESVREEGERFVEYYPVYLQWDQRLDLNPLFGPASYHTHGTFGTGYIAFTEIAFYLSVFSDLSREVPFRKIGLFGSVLGDKRKPTKEDKLWKISYSALLAESLAQHAAQPYVKLDTTYGEWSVYPGMRGYGPTISTIAHWGRTGRLKNILTPEKDEGREEADTTVLAALKQLAELKSTGILTEDEFEAKKKELLARL